MTLYAAPTRDMKFVVKELLQLSSVNTLPGFEDATDDLFDAILDESARFSQQELAPLNRSGDLEGARLVGGEVHTAAGFKEAYAQFIDSGWGGLTSSPDYGGQGLPHLLGAAVEEMWHSANMSFTLCPLLTRGAIEAIHYAGSTALRERYLPAMVEGRWAGTMNLTEPQAGSDLAALRSQAIPENDYYRIRGQKVFITYGDHDLTENIIHLVLARLPDAPAGVKGISLFLVPKFLVHQDGSLGERNDIQTVSLEHKLGIHASPTCVLAFGDKQGAIGYLVGKPHCGLETMFVMMNAARFSVGVQGLAIGERAYQAAVHYALQRIQGIPIGHKAPAPIAHHPDVKRILATLQTRLEGCRAMAYYAGMLLDQAHAETDVARRTSAQARSDVLTPIVKGFCTETGVWATNEALQVFGGMGYMEEMGAAQYLRDARISTIYEGTTGIQANDLLGRKLLRDNGVMMNALLSDIRTTVSATAAQSAAVQPVYNALSEALSAAESATAYLLRIGPTQSATALGGAVPYLTLMGWLVSGWLWARSATLAQAALQSNGPDSHFYRTKLVHARFFALHELGICAHLQRVITQGSDPLQDIEVASFGEHGI